MSKECEHNCEECNQECESRTEAPKSLIAQLNKDSKVKKVIGVVSGKGGVGKSMVTSLLAVLMNRYENHTAILDADITGPSIPKAFGISERAKGNDEGIIPARSKTGIEIISSNMLLENDTDPIIWRGPLIGNMVKQFWTDVIWDNIDVMFIDMPPGTGDVSLTVFQSIPVDGIVIVTSPQELVSMIVSKAVNMADMMNIPVIGIVENMSYFLCPDNQKEYKIFGDSHIEQIAADFKIKTIAKLPIEPRLASACDNGIIELFAGDWLEPIVKEIDKIKGKGE